MTSRAKVKRKRTARRVASHLYDVASRFVTDPRGCVRNRSARSVIRRYDLNWTELIKHVRDFCPDGIEDDLVDRIGDLLAGYCLVRDMESRTKGALKGGLRHPSTSMGRGFRRRIRVWSPSNKKVGSVSLQDILGTPDFTPAVTARLRTRLIAEMHDEFVSQEHPKWLVRDILPKVWELVGEGLSSESIPRVLRRFRKRQESPGTGTTEAHLQL